MRTNPLFGPTMQALTIVAIAASAIVPVALAGAQDTGRPSTASTTGALTVAEARAMARRASPDLTAAREAVAAAAARERQARAFPNPSLSYQREQTSRTGERTSQNIASVDQPVELGGVRSARVTVARLRREVAEARLAAAEAQLDFDVARAYALATAADRHAQLAQDATTAFARARSVSETRLVAGDVSGYADRRIRLEAARYAGLLAGALVSRRTARLALASLLGSTPAEAERFVLALDDLPAPSVLALSVDSLRTLAGRHRAELTVAVLEAGAAAADAQLASRERLPIPTFSLGLKSEQVVGGESLNGFIAGVALPLPVWDRRAGAIEASNAEARRRVAETDVVRRRIAREVDDAADAFRAVVEQLSILRPQLGAAAQAALRAAQVAYSEGEITLVEWLDAVRAYQEAESTFATLRAESLIRRAALDRAIGISVSGN